MREFSFNDSGVKEEIRSRLDIANVVSRYVTLKPSGQNMKGLCPFHKEKTPSFMVNPAKGIFHCFGCGKGGDVFSFLMEMEGIGFAEVIRMTAEETGVKLKTPERPTKRNDMQGLSKTELLKIHEMAAHFFYDQMQKSETAISYFKSRGLFPEIVRDFRLGYAPDGWTNLIEFARSEGVVESSLVACGLAVEKGDGGSVYDRFRDRIIFPVRDISGRVIAFAGRGMERDAQPKYLNSPETPLYLKSKILFGLDRARQAVKEKNRLIIVEGYMDFLSLFQAGIKNCAATSGTALTADHGQIIRRFTNRVVLFFDGDTAGIGAAERAVFVLAPLNLDVRVCILPEGEDPDSIVGKHGPEAVLKRIDEAQPGIEFLIGQSTLRYGCDTPPGKSSVLQSILPVLKGISDAIVRSETVKYVAERLKIAEQIIYRRVREISNGILQGDDTRLSISFKEYLGTVEAHCIQLLVQYPSLIEIAMERISTETFTDQFSIKLYSIVVEAYRNDSSLANILDYTENEDLKRVLSHQIMVQPWPEETAQEELYHTIKRLNVKLLKTKLRQIRDQQKRVKDPDEMKRLQQEHKKITMNLKELGMGW